MVTRLSQLFVRTLREDPSDAEVTSHRLLVRAGYIRRQAPGIFAWLPLGLRVRRKVEQVIHDEMERAGAQQVHFPALLPREPYEVTGRWTEYGDGIFRLKDRKDADYLLAPTHEEVFTLLVKDLYNSYKDLPLAIYQIQDKYRDEARPRAGLLRGREFSMKDAYSFDYTDEGLELSYQAQRDAYERIFTRLGLDYVIVSADAGAMGGSKSEEFLHPTPIGEDTFVQSDSGYAANVEAYRTPAPAEIPIDGQPAATVFDSPNTPTIETLVALANANHPRADRPWTAADTLKNVVLAMTNLDGSRELVAVGLPGDRAPLPRALLPLLPPALAAAAALPLLASSTPATLRNRGCRACLTTKTRSPGSPSTSGSPSSKNLISCPGRVPGSTVTSTSDASRTSFTASHSSHSSSVYCWYMPGPIWRVTTRWRQLHLRFPGAGASVILSRVTLTVVPR